jgi:hypothetical protein
VALIGADVDPMISDNAPTIGPLSTVNSEELVSPVGASTKGVIRMIKWKHVLERGSFLASGSAVAQTTCAAYVFIIVTGAEYSAGGSSVSLTGTLVNGSAPANLDVSRLHTTPAAWT